MDEERKKLNRVYLLCIACIAGALLVLYFANRGTLQGWPLYVCFAVVLAMAVALFALLRHTK